MPTVNRHASREGSLQQLREQAGGAASIGLRLDVRTELACAVRCADTGAPLEKRHGVRLRPRSSPDSVGMRLAAFQSAPCIMAGYLGHIHIARFAQARQARQRVPASDAPDACLEAIDTPQRRLVGSASLVFRTWCGGARQSRATPVHACVTRRSRCAARFSSGKGEVTRREPVTTTQPSTGFFALARSVQYLIK